MQENPAERRDFSCLTTHVLIAPRLRSRETSSGPPGEPQLRFPPKRQHRVDGFDHSAGMNDRDVREEVPMNMTRRGVFATAGAAASAVAFRERAQAQSFDFKPNQRYPEASVEILDPSFAKYRVFSSTL